MEEKPRRLRFSLRTLFVVVTVGCVWIGYSLNWIRQRHEFLDHEVALRHKLPFQDHPNGNRYTPNIRTCAYGSETVAPSMLWAFGGQGYEEMWVLAKSDDVQELTDDDRRRARLARRLFPEAIVMVAHPQPDSLDAKLSLPPD
jgi:hypothetical protein